MAVDYLYAQSDADKISGAVYSRKYSNPVVGGAGLGITLFQKVYVGARYEFWYGLRKFTFNDLGQSDTLKLQTLGAEFGYYHSNPRVYLMLLAGIHYPLKAGVEVVSTTNQTFQSNTKNLIYSGRAYIGIRFNSLYSFFLEGGYRSVNLGNLKAGPTDYLSGGASFNLSGPFIGIGLLFEF